MSTLIALFLETLWLILPAYSANGAATISGGKIPIDMNKRFIDGMPILGRGKTVEGFVIGVLVATIVSTIQLLSYPFLQVKNLEFIYMTPFLGFMLGLGALTGDAVESFVKRRMGMKRGEPLPFFDQNDFVMGALLFSSFFAAIKLEWVVIALIFTPVIHLSANFFAYLLGIKSVPY